MKHLKANDALCATLFELDHLCMPSADIIVDKPVLDVLLEALAHAYPGITREHLGEAKKVSKRLVLRHCCGVDVDEGIEV
jgi:hypothetical protein